ncbi:hypothetical protein GOZ97_10705 [Agrobacterium vitis]|uniref:DUF6460 domain-containing protein n=2 Tax=Rhizobium/Agrobacterium group TaxID=227290 RepID=B9JR06_ALLAM|nr:MULTISPECIES: DUF6460 domain-containing protein [Rhizobium/Agrobacterium group]ACM35419.1 conserved hypothetical protein [Allorhizobium ampelinum S4]MCF1435456.1 hypothetical protein [Allorhizobium ampelinum]MCF1449597.1 hypothetical protein [Allorhizobium ampelinum]MCF1464006.1 hypothetical protein [Allorhizobium ampelinum]MCF1469008.1 hypothetical protein [Agrobacterium vitis]
MTDGVNRFLGDSIGRTIIKLLVVSVIVGFVMRIFGIYPYDIIEGIRHFILDVWHKGFAALGQFGDYLLLGASIVIPVFILIRLLNLRK